MVPAASSRDKRDRNTLAGSPAHAVGNQQLTLPDVCLWPKSAKKTCLSHCIVSVCCTIGKNGSCLLLLEIVRRFSSSAVRHSFQRRFVRLRGSLSDSPGRPTACAPRTCRSQATGAAWKSSTEKSVVPATLFLNRFLSNCRGVVDFRKHRILPARPQELEHRQRRGSGLSRRSEGRCALHPRPDRPCRTASAPPRNCACR